MAPCVTLPCACDYINSSPNAIPNEYIDSPSSVLPTRSTHASRPLCVAGIAVARITIPITSAKPIRPVRPRSWPSGITRRTVRSVSRRRSRRSRPTHWLACNFRRRGRCRSAHGLAFDGLLLLRRAVPVPVTVRAVILTLKTLAVRGMLLLWRARCGWACLLLLLLLASL